MTNFTIDGKQIVWTDGSGVTHQAIGATIHPRVRLLWTRCERQDIPGNTAWLRRSEDKITCRACLKKASPYGDMCMSPELCGPKGYCPRDQCCGN